MKNTLITLTLLFSLMGCTTGRELKLDAKWEPLRSVEEGTDKLFAEGVSTTIGHFCYVPDLQQWVKDFPENSVRREALLRHEQIHSIRELKMGLPLWLAKYVTEKTFRWQEEQIGYEQEITYLFQHGIPINRYQYAIIFSHDYQSLGGQMVTYEEALKWVTDLSIRLSTKTP